MIIQRSISLPFERVGLSAPTCRLDLGRDDLQFTFRDVAGEFLSDPVAPTLKLAYDVPGGGKGSRCELCLTRDRRTEPFETSLTFKTVEGRRCRPGCSTCSSTPTTGWEPRPR